MRVPVSRRAGLMLLLSPIAALPARTAWPQTPDPLAGRFGGAFSLVDHSGTRVTNSTYFGKFALVYFGFTTCLDTCPVDLPLIMGAVDRLGKRAQNLVPLFITVDPRDTPEVMKAYIEANFPGLTGLSGSEAELAAAARAFRVHRRKLSLPPNSHPAHAHGAHSGHGNAASHAHAEAAYTIDHGSLCYLLGPDGKFLTLFPHDTSIDRIVEILGKYLPQA